MRTVRMLLAEKGAQYDQVPVHVLKGEPRQPEHLARHPFGKVPVVDHDGFRILETSAIAPYLDEVLPGPDYSAHVLALYDKCVKNRRALYSECLFFSPARHQPERHTKVLFMPLSPDDKTVNMIFVIQVFLYIDRATRERHFVDARPYKEITHILL